MRSWVVAALVLAVVVSGGGGRAGIACDGRWFGEWSYAVGILGTCVCLWNTSATTTAQGQRLDAYLPPTTNCTPVCADVVTFRLALNGTCDPNTGSLSYGNPFCHYTNITGAIGTNGDSLFISGYCSDQPLYITANLTRV